MRKPRSVVLVGLGLAFGVALGLLWVRQKRSPALALKRSIWRRALTNRHSERQVDAILRDVDRRYAALLAAGLPYQERALRTHMKENILPGLALYQALRDRYQSRQAALAETAILFKASTAPLLLPMWVLRLFPDPFPFFKWANRRLMQRDYLSSAWEVRWVADSRDDFAFNIYRCFYLNVLSAYGAPELTPLFCRTDDWMMEALPPSIAWQRTRTLGGGDLLCDFRWCRRAAREK